MSRSRPITLVRCPTGRQKKCFYQRHAGSGVPRRARRGRDLRLRGAGAYLYIEDAKGLVALVQMGVLEMHPWGARVDRPERPDRVIFDLDPGEGLGFADVVAGGAARCAAALDRARARQLRQDDRRQGPARRRADRAAADWREVKAFAKALAETLAAGAPDRYLTRISKAERRGRIFIDYLRNDPTSTAVAPYSTRARAGAPVAMPVAWDELSPELDPGLVHRQHGAGHRQGTPGGSLGRDRHGAPAPAVLTEPARLGPVLAQGSLAGMVAPTCLPRSRLT